uniref:Uncharacterized protein n=1 Tax=Oryza meridionalis TaxID=40149 RepID=A0A0E0CIV9_9ORYZ
MASSVSRAAGAAATMAKAGWRAVAQGFSPPFLDQASQISSPPALFSGLRTLGLRIFSQHQSYRMGQQGCGQVLQRLPCFLHSICHWRHKGISYHHQQLLRGNPEAPKIDVLERVRGSQSQGRAPQQGKRDRVGSAFDNTPYRTALPAAATAAAAAIPPVRSSVLRR